MLPIATLIEVNMTIAAACAPHLQAIFTRATNLPTVARLRPAAQRSRSLTPSDGVSEIRVEREVTMTSAP